MTNRSEHQQVPMRYPYGQGAFEAREHTQVFKPKQRRGDHSRKLPPQMLVADATSRNVPTASPKPPAFGG